MEWFVALFALTLAGLGSAAPLQQGGSEGWNPVSKDDQSTNTGDGRSLNSILADNDPNELHRRGDELYKHMEDADYWAQFTQPQEIKQKVNELMHSPRFLHRISSTINSAKQDNGTIW